MPSATTVAVESVVIVTRRDDTRVGSLSDVLSYECMATEWQVPGVSSPLSG